MGLRDQLKAGMTFEQVKNVFKGWREANPSAFLAPERTHLFYTADFLPPKNSNESKLRMTFDNGTLLFWGDPADLGNSPDISTESA